MSILLWILKPVSGKENQGGSFIRTPSSNRMQFLCRQCPFRQGTTQISSNVDFPSQLFANFWFSKQLVDRDLFMHKLNSLLSGEEIRQRAGGVVGDGSLFEAELRRG